MGAASWWENQTEKKCCLCATQGKKRQKKYLTVTDIPETERPSFRLILCKTNDVRKHQPTASLVTQPHFKPLHLHTDAGCRPYFPRLKRRLNPSLRNLETLALSGCQMEETDRSSVQLKRPILSNRISRPHSDVYECSSEIIYKLYRYFFQFL